MKTYQFKKKKYLDHEIKKKIKIRVDIDRNDDLFRPVGNTQFTGARLFSHQKQVQNPSSSTSIINNNRTERNKNVVGENK